MERCVTCMYYDRLKAGGDAKSANAGQCRRSGPTLSPINQKSYMIEGVWPTVRDDDWCGEWKALQTASGHVAARGHAEHPVVHAVSRRAAAGTENHDTGRSRGTRRADQRNPPGYGVDAAAHAAAVADVEHGDP